MDKVGSSDFIDAETEWRSNKDDITFRYIVMKHLMKIALLCCVEFRGGYWQQKITIGKDGPPIEEKVYVPDTREEFSNAVNFLHDILIPYFDKSMEESSESINKSLKEIRIKCIQKTSVNETQFLDTSEEDSVILSSGHYTGNDKLVIESYRFIKMNLMRKLFQEISKFLKRVDYLGAQSLEE